MVFAKDLVIKSSRTMAFVTIPAAVNRAKIVRCLFRPLASLVQPSRSPIGELEDLVTRLFRFGHICFMALYIFQCVLFVKTHKMGNMSE